MTEGKHRAPETGNTARPVRKLPPAGKGQVRPDPTDPRYDEESTFGKGWS